MTTTTCKIELDGAYSTRMTCCNTPNLTIPRTQPVVMTQYMSPMEWTSFCSKIDSALRPISKFRRIVNQVYFLYFLVVWAIVIYFFYMLATNSWLSGVGTILYCILLALLVLTIALQCCGRSKANATNIKIQEICQQVSVQYPNLLFKSNLSTIFYRRRYGYYIAPGILVTIKNPAQQYPAAGDIESSDSLYNGNYIEDIRRVQSPIPEASFIANAGGGGRGVAVPTAPSEAAAVAAGSSQAAPLADAVIVTGAGTPAERLAQLDQMKNLISAEEYNNKRNQILECV